MNPEHYLFMDERLTGRCIYCGDKPETRDHVPPKVFLDDPLPKDLPVVESCTKCNNRTSADEQYLACFLEVVLTGSTELVRRQKVKSAFEHSPKLRAMIQASAIDSEKGRVWTPDLERVRRVIVKLARAHLAYETGEVVTSEPTVLTINPIALMSSSELDSFEKGTDAAFAVFPELGTRAFLRASGAYPYQNTNGPWVHVQEGLYRYTAGFFALPEARIVLSDYLACVVEWND